jgi:hypothetical protein
MKTTRTVKCHVCDKIVNAQGLGGHLRLKHGIVEYKTVNTSKQELTPVNTGSTQVQRELNAGLTQVQRELNAGLTQVQRELNASSTQVQRELTTQVKRASDYVKKDEIIVKKTSVSMNVSERLKELAQICNKHYKAQTKRSDIEGFKEWQEAYTELCNLIAGKPTSDPDNLLIDDNWYKKNPDKILGSIWGK